MWVFWTILCSAAGTLFVVVVVRNLTSSEKKLCQEVGHKFGRFVDTAWYQRMSPMH